MTDAIHRACPRCGTALTHHSAEGLCPRCLLAMNLAPETVLADDSDAVRNHAPAPAPEIIGPLFPQLEILETLGRGGMGIVYKARQRALDRIVALKILAPERERDAEFATRFAHEAQALARLSHPHIVTVHDFGEVNAPDGRALFYLLMEFVDGVNLRQILRTRRLAPAEALAIVPTICEALQYAHSRGIVHRDIKPENLLLDKEGKIKIADFGIAKIVGAELAAAEQKAAGTPEYMAPEQKSAPENVDHRADIYSLGVVLYEMLTGELPSKQLEAPSSRVTGVHFDVRLDEIVLRALHAQPELRYHTALDLKTQLESLGERQPRSPSRTFPVDERASRRSTPANSNTTSKPRASAIRRGLSIMCSLLIIGAGINVTSELLWPRYYAKVLMEVQPEKQPYRDQPWNARALYDAFVAEQKRKLRAPETLARVAQELRLESGFSLFANDITAQLARSIEIHEVRNRGPLMELGVYNRNPELAAKIANTLAMVYQDLRLKEFQAKVEQSLARLNSEVELQRKRMQHAAAERDEILRRDQIVDPAPDDFQSPGEMTNRQIADLENRAKAQKETVDNLRMQLSAIINLEPLEIRQVLQTLKIDDPLVAKAFGALNMQLAEQLRLTSSGLGEEHPAVVSTRALITEYTRQLTEMLQSFRQIRSNKLEIEERALREITGELEATKAHATMPPEKLKRYLEAKTRYIEARKVFEAAEKFRIDQLQHNLDFEGPKIWERAETPPRVSWPTFRQLWYSLSHPLS